MLFTCVFVPAPVPAEVTNMPSLVPLNAPMQIQGRGTAYWYDMLGRRHHAQDYNDSEITAPNTAGWYLLILQGEHARESHRILVK
jgi:hypothetical protein